MYCTAADLKKLISADALGQLADDGPGGAAAEDIIAEAIDQADREIDAHLVAVLGVPLDPVPPLAANISARLAIHNLYARRTHLEIPDHVGDAHKRALKLLEQIAQGKISLGAPETGESTGPDESARPVVQTRPPEFPDDMLEKF